MIVRALTYTLVLTSLAIVLAGCTPAAGLPAVYRVPESTMAPLLDDADTTVAATMTRWWLQESHDPLQEIKRIARDSSRDIPSPREMLGEGVAVDEFDIVNLALATNLDIRISDKDRRVAVEAVGARTGQVYDTVLALRASETSRENAREAEATTSFSSLSSVTGAGTSPTTDEDTVGRDQIRTGRGAIRQRIFTGGTIELFYQESDSEEENAEGRAGDPIREAEAGVRLTQPLLRGFGRTVTEQPIQAARINQEIGEEGFRSAIIAQLSTALNTYYDLIFALENAAVQRITLQQALDLLEINISRERVGDLAAVDVEQARADAAFREEQYLIAVRQIFDAQDQLRRVLNIDLHPEIGWQKAFLPLDVPTYGDVSGYNEEELIRTAFLNRPDLRQAVLNVDLAQLNQDVAENGLLPRLDLSASGGDIGAGRGGREARGEVRDNEYDAYEIALDLEYPLLNREARHTFRQRQLERQRTELQVSNLALSIRSDIRTKVRSLRTNRLRIDVTLERVRAEQLKYDAELKRYEVGLSTSFQLLTFLEDLATAKVTHLQAIVDYQKSLIDIAVSSGTLLQELGISIELGTISRAAEFFAPPATAPEGADLVETPGELGPPDVMTPGAYSGEQEARERDVLEQAAASLEDAYGGSGVPPSEPTPAPTPAPTP